MSDVAIYIHECCCCKAVVNDVVVAGSISALSQTMDHLPQRVSWSPSPTSSQSSNCASLNHCNRLRCILRRPLPCDVAAERCPFHFCRPHTGYRTQCVLCPLRLPLRLQLPRTRPDWRNDRRSAGLLDAGALILTRLARPLCWMRVNTRPIPYCVTPKKRSPISQPQIYAIYPHYRTARIAFHLEGGTAPIPLTT